MFLRVKSDTGAANPWEYHDAAAGDYKVGQLLNMSEGKLTAISGAYTGVPAYICMAERTVVDGEALPVVRVNHTDIYETTLSAAAPEAKEGDKLEVSDGGLEADDTAAGAFELCAILGTEAGGIVRGRFVAASNG